MIFSSIEYLLFLPLVAILYWRTRGTVRLALVVVASYAFYMSWLPVYGLLLLAMTTVSWALGLALGWANEKSPGWRKPLLLLGLLGNLACLCYYKYANFFATNIFGACNWFAQWMNVPQPFESWTALNILLPLGISFFVFEFVHYLTDIYRGDKPVRSWLEFAAFAAFFPSQIAGPIKRFQDFLNWLRKPIPWSSQLLSEGGTLIAQGMFKKVAIADPVGLIIASSFASSAPLSAPDALLASIGFVIQVYCDFSGYTDIGRGSALLLGIRLPENFALPYLAHDIGDFWRRWHMSLSTWLRDYIYIPLGGSRQGAFRQWLNLFITMTLCGLWHGAAWHYVLFGALQGIGMGINREWREVLKRVQPLRAVCETSAGKWGATLVTMIFVTATYTVFRAPDVPTAINVLQSWFNTANLDCTLWLPTVKAGVPYLLAIYMGFWLVTEVAKKIVVKPSSAGGEQWVGVYPTAVRYAAWTAATFLIVAARPMVATPFVYFQF